MAGFNDTADLERALLHLMVTSKMLLKQHISKLRPEFFTTKERKFIRECIQRNFKVAKGLLTKNVFDYEVHSRIESGEHHFYDGEWTIIADMNISDDADVLIERLHKADVGRTLLDVAEDMVELVEKGKIDDALRQLRNSNAKIADYRDSQPLVELTDYRRRLEIIMDKKAHPERYLGTKTGLKTFDERTGGLFSGEMTLVSGITGLGKSTLLKQIETGVVLCNHCRNVLHICNEEHLLQVQTKFDAQLTRVPYSDFKLATITDESIEKWKRVMEIDLKKPNIGRIFIKEVPAFTDVTLIEEAMGELENMGVHVHVVIIDHLPHVRPIEQAWGEYDEQGKAAADCKELARSHEISVVVATQAATVVEEKQSRGRRAGKLDVYGSKEQVHVANTSLVITEIGRATDQEDREDWERDIFWCGDVKKNRDGATFSFKLRHCVKIGLVEEVFDKQTPSIKAAVDAALKEGEAEKAVAQPPSVSVVTEIPPLSPAKEDAVPSIVEVPPAPPAAEESSFHEDIVAKFIAKRKKKLS